jgi:HNH endonuclease/AP2 domain
MPGLAIEYLRQCFDVDFDTGQLRWRVRPREHFLSKRGWNVANAQYAGKSAGSLTPKGYVIVAISIHSKPQFIFAHRIVWALAHGKWPTEIDHHDGNRSNNSLANLRDATRSENNHNLRIPKHNASGFLGVSRRNENKWRAQITANGRNYSLGSFPDRQSAANAYLAAKARLHPFQPVPRQ